MSCDPTLSGTPPEAEGPVGLGAETGVSPVGVFGLLSFFLCFYLSFAIWRERHRIKASGRGSGQGYLPLPGAQVGR